MLLLLLLFLLRPGFTSSFFHEFKLLVLLLVFPFRYDSDTIPIRVPSINEKGQTVVQAKEGKAKGGVYRSAAEKASAVLLFSVPFLCQSFLRKARFGLVCEVEL